MCFKRAPLLACTIALLISGCTVAPPPVLPERTELPEIVVAPRKEAETSAIGQAADSDSPPAEIEPAAPEPIVTTEITAPMHLSVVAVGDMMLGGSGTEFYQRENYDYAFANVRDILTDADLFIGNIETALTTSDELLVEKTYRFRNPPQPVAAALARAGLDVANLANNHTLDYGYSGLAETREALHAVNVATIGAGDNLAQARRAAIFDIEGMRVGFLAYSNTFPEEFWSNSSRPGTAFGHERHVREDVRRLKDEGVEIVIVSFHWGREGTTELRDYQPLLGRAAIDAGANAVIGHHPHILQAVERYRDGVIFYSLGNFTFGSYSRRARDSAIARLHFTDGALAQVEIIPINVLNIEVLFQPTLLTGTEATRVLKDLQALSRRRGTALEIDGNRAVIDYKDVSSSH